MVLGIIILIFFLGMLLAGILFYSKQKFINLEIFLKEAENNMDIVLEKKLELFRRLISHMKKKKIDAVYPNIEKCKDLKEDHRSFHSALFDIYTEMILLVDEMEEKLKDEKSISLLDQLMDNEDDLTAIVKYYNDYATDYNFYLHHFPTSLGAKFLRYDDLELFRNEKRETFEILKEKQKE